MYCELSTHKAHSVLIVDIELNAFNGFCCEIQFVSFALHINPVGLKKTVVGIEATPATR